MMIIKRFEYKGQMINYYNKVKDNPKIEFCYRCFDAKQGYIVGYNYKK